MERGGGRERDGGADAVYVLAMSMPLSCDMYTSPLPSSSHAPTPYGTLPCDMNSQGKVRQLHLRKEKELPQLERSILCTRQMLYQLSYRGQPSWAGLI